MTDPAALPLPVHAAANQGVMERRDPIPAGRYWVYIDESEVARWSAWVTSNEGRVKVLVTEPQLTLSSWLPAIFQTRWDLSVIQSVKGYWILFEASEPVKWVGLGYPTTVIDPAIKSATDVMTAPAPTPDTDMLGDSPLGAVLGQLKTILLIGGGLFIAVQIMNLAQTLQPRGRRT